MNHNHRGYCSRPDFRRSVDISDTPFLGLEEIFEDTGAEDWIDHSIVYNNAMSLVDAINSSAASQELSEGESPSSVAAAFTAEVYVDRKTGEIKAVDMDASADLAILEDKNTIKILFSAKFETEITGNGELGAHSSQYNFDSEYRPDTPEYWLNTPEEQAHKNLQATLNMLDEQ